MALVTNQWNTVTFNALAHASWATVPTRGLPAEVLQAVRDGTSIDVFCLDDSGPVTFTYLNGPYVVVPTAVIATDTPIATDVETIDSTSETWYSMRAAFAGEWRWYSSQLGVVRELTSPSGLASFLS